MVGVVIIFVIGLVIAPITMFALRAGAPSAVANAFYLIFLVEGLLGGVILGLTYRAKPRETDDPVGGALGSLGIALSTVLILGASVVIVGWLGIPNTITNNPFWHPLNALLYCILAYQVGFWPSRAYRISKKEPSRSVEPPTAPVTKTAKSSILRLADPAHPARKHLEQTVKIVDQYVQVELAGDRTAMKVSATVGEMEKVLSSLDEAVAICPDDMDLLVAKACVLHASAQFKSAEEVLDMVLSKVPDHFEAKMWKSHWETWSDALRFPRWDERLSLLHPVMASHLGLDHRIQVVRDGMQKTLAIVTGVQGPPFDSRTQIKVEWVLSKTPYGPLVAYYPKIIEPSGEPSTMEAFLPIFQPTLFSPMEGYFLIQQLAFTPYCFVVLVSGNSVLLNCRIVFGQKTTQKVSDMAVQLGSTQSYLPQHQFESAMQWHMNNFDMNRLIFE